MVLKKIFRQFLEYRAQLKTIYVASSDEEGKPNCAPRMLIDIVKPNYVYYIDFKSSQTYANLQQNGWASLAFMDEGSFAGFKLNGFSQVIHSGQEFELVEKKLTKIIDSYQVERMIERIKGILSNQPREIVLPRDYVIVKFIAEEQKETVHKNSGHLVSKIADLQIRIDELESFDAAQKKAWLTMKASRDFFKKESGRFKRRGLEDGLTGLYNRRGFTLLVEQQFSIAKRSGKEIFLIFSDIDHLKPINDAFGHMAGDQVLVDIAQILKKSFRESDIIARIGGDEFVIALIDYNSERF